MTPCSENSYHNRLKYFVDSKAFKRGLKYNDALYTDYINALRSLVNYNDLCSRENCWVCFNLGETSQRSFIHPEFFKKRSPWLRAQTSQVLTHGDSLESEERFRVYRTNWNFWVTWFGLFRSRTWNCDFGGGHLVRHSENPIQKSCSRILHSFRQVFSSRFKVFEKLEFARTAQFSSVFNSNCLLFTAARTINYISN